MEKKRQKLLYSAFFFLIFGFLFIWFSRIHALVPYDGDDWTYLAYVRPATPVWGEWNPAKVFPEVAFPFFSTIAAFVLAPLTGDYITAQTLMHAFVVSVSVTGYLFCFSALLRRCFSFSRLDASLLTLLFLVFHFLAMRSSESDNQYMLYCVDLNCYYNYLLPSILNASVVMLVIANEKLRAFLRDGAPAAKGCFYVIVYLAIFSNLPSSGILAAYAGSVLLLELLRRLKKRSWQGFLGENAFSLGILAAWLVSAVYELSGGRAASASGSSPISYNVYLSIKNFAGVLLGCNRVFLFCVFAVVIAACILLLCTRNKATADKFLSSHGMALLISLAAYSIYLIALCAAVNPNSILRSEYLFGVFFFGALLAMLALAYLVSRYPKIQLVLPLLILFLASGADTREKTFLESNFSNAPPAQCAEISRYLIRQLQEAEQGGLTETVLRVPMHVSDLEKDDNWPHSLFLMKRVPDTLYAHGLIRSRIDVTPVADPSVNEQFLIPLPEGSFE